MTIPLWMRALAAGIIIAAIVGIGWTIHHHIYMSGYNAHKAETDKRDAQIAADMAAKLVKDTQAALEKERRLAQSMADRDAKYQQEKANAKANTDRIIADLRSGVKRLSVPSVGCSIRRTTEDPGTDVAAGTGAEGRADLDAKTSEFLIGIAEAGDQARSKHAKVVDAYNELRKTCMQQSESPQTN